jgi:hypothetical protein
MAKDTGSFLVAQVKANQQTLHDGIEAICAVDPPADRAETVDRNRHGRQEYRRVETFDVTGRLGPDWDGLIVAAVRVTRLTWHKDTPSGLWHPTNETSFFASQTDRPPPPSAPRSASIGASKTEATTSAMSPSLKTIAAFETNRATSPGSAPSPSISFAPTVPPTSAGNSTSMRSTRITPCHTSQRKEN